MRIAFDASIKGDIYGDLHTFEGKMTEIDDNTRPIFVACIWIGAMIVTLFALWFCDIDGSRARNEARQKAFNEGKAGYVYGGEAAE